MSDVRELVLGVGQGARLTGSFLVNRGVVYAGMPSPGVYSLALEWTSVYNSAAYNLYFPADRREILLAGRELVIERVTPDEIRFRVYPARA